MLFHYLTIAYRSILRGRLVSVMSILVLAMGLVSFITAFAVTDYWDASERQFPKSDRTFVIMRDVVPLNGDLGDGALPRTPLHLAGYLRSEFPQLQAVARALPDVDVGASTADRAVRVDRLTADPEFLEIFDLPFIVGDPATALQPGSVVLTERGAERLFGDEDPMGKTVTFANIADTTVTGIIGPIEDPSHLGDSSAAPMHFDVLVAWSAFEEMVVARYPNYFSQPEVWRSGRFLTYALLPEDGSLTASEFQARLEDMASRRIPAEQLVGTDIRFSALPVGELMMANLDSVLFGRNSSRLSVAMLLPLLGALILAVACVNYASITAARGLGRAREIAVRKVTGASKAQVIGQFLIEVGLLTSIALFVAVSSLAAIVPFLRGAMDIDLSVAIFDGANFWLMLGGLVALVTLAAGAYPARVIATIRPVEALRIRPDRGRSRTASTFLVGVQFAITSLLIIAVIVTYGQNVELRRTGLGLAADPLLMIDNPAALTGVDADTLRTQLTQYPEIVSVTSIQQRPWELTAGLLYISRSIEAGAQQRPVFYNSVGADFFSTFDIELIAGRAFDIDRSEDITPGGSLEPSRVANVVIDRALAVELGFDAPEQAVDQELYEVAAERPIRMRVIGVVEDKAVHFIGLGAKSNLYAFDRDMENEVVRLSRNDVPEALATINRVWQRLSPNMALSSYFVDALFEENYRNFGRVSQVFLSLALFALVISAMGLGAMAVQVSRRRVREIAVRKTLGATTRQAVVMLVRDFSKPVLIGCLVAWPLGYFAAQAYLDVFIRRVPVTVLPFLGSLVLSLALAWLVVGGQALRAARVRPGEVLRTE